MFVFQQTITCYPIYSSMTCIRSATTFIDLFSQYTTIENSVRGILKVWHSHNTPDICSFVTALQEPSSLLPASLSFPWSFCVTVFLIAIHPFTRHPVLPSNHTFKQVLPANATASFKSVLFGITENENKVIPQCWWPFHPGQGSEWWFQSILCLWDISVYMLKNPCLNRTEFFGITFSHIFNTLPKSFFALP